MNNSDPAENITGTIAANPNSVFFGQGCIISWETNDPVGAEIRVLTARTDDEKLVTKGGSCGNVEIPWIQDSNEYEFRLYGSSSPEVAIGSVKVRRNVESAPTALREIADEVKRGNVPVSELSSFIAAVMPHCLQSSEHRELFLNWEKHGFHVTRVHFYEPIPDTQSLPETLWSQSSELVGIDMNDAMQLDLLRNHFSKFHGEYEAVLTGPPPGRPFRGTDALVAYCMVRHFQSPRIVEIGSGFSSLVLGKAAAKNKSSALICIDPFPHELVRKHNNVPALQSLIETRVQDVDLDFFSQLEPGDILFIDSSHTVKTGGDVNYLFLEVLPRLKSGVIVHVHDIFFPFEYRRDWMLEEFRFWTEQYLLQAFLIFNSEFEVLMANSYLNHYYAADLKAAFPNLNRWIGGSFWMRRKPAATSRPAKQE